MTQPATRLKGPSIFNDLARWRLTISRAGRAESDQEPGESEAVSAGSGRTPTEGEMNGRNAPGGK